MSNDKKESRFPFIEDKILRQNLDITLDLVISLNISSEDTKLPAPIKSSFRKMVIVSTASIIEALLLYCLKKSKTEAELATRKKVFKETLLIYQIDQKTRIVKGEEVEEIIPCKFSKLNLDNLTKLCKEHKIILDKSLIEDLGSVRDLRNKQHIGTLEVIDDGYSKKDLEFVFSVAGKIKKLTKELRLLP